MILYSDVNESGTSISRKVMTKPACTITTKSSAASRLHFQIQWGSVTNRKLSALASDAVRGQAILPLKKYQYSHNAATITGIAHGKGIKAMSNTQMAIPTLLTRNPDAVALINTGTRSHILRVLFSMMRL